MVLSVEQPNEVYKTSKTSDRPSLSLSAKCSVSNYFFPFLSFPFVFSSAVLEKFRQYIYSCVFQNISTQNKLEL